MTEATLRMEFGNIAFDRTVDTDRYWVWIMDNVLEIDNLQFSQYEEFNQILFQDFSPQSLQELEDSLLAEVFAFPEATNKLYNHIADEHEYFKKNYEHNQIIQESVTTNHSCELKKEIKTEQCHDMPEFYL